MLGGAALTLGVAGLATLAGWGVATLADLGGAPGLLLEAVALKLTLSLRGLVAAARLVGAELARDDLPAARAAVGTHLVSRPTAALDEGQVASAAIESVAENLTDGFLAPLGFYLVFGLPGAAFYRAVNTADAMLGYREGALEHFGKAAARLDDLLNLVPSRLAAAALVVGAAVVGADARGALRVMWRDRDRTASPNAGWTMAAMAGALAVTLEKPGAYRLGDGPAPGRADIERALRVLGGGAAVTLVAAAVGALAYA